MIREKHEAQMNDAVPVPVFPEPHLHASPHMHLLLLRMTIGKHGETSVVQSLKQTRKK